VNVLLRDLQYALRQFVGSPLFALTALLSLALGIGATTAIYSVIYSTLLNPYPFKDANRIFRVAVNSKTGESAIVALSGPQISVLKQSPVVEDVIALDDASFSLTGGDFPEDVEVGFVTPNAFQFLGDPPLLGRGIQPSDVSDGQQAQSVVVLSAQFWRRHFSANQDVVGQSLQLNHKDYRIVGIAEPRWVSWSGKDVYLPLGLAQNANFNDAVCLRLKPGVARKTANAALQPLMEEFARNAPSNFPEHFQVGLQGLNDSVVRRMGSTLYLLLGGVALLLCIGCANVSILLLARGTAREHELAVRVAIGAPRRRIVRQLLTESLLLACSGAALGVVLAYAGVVAIKVIFPEHFFAPGISIGIKPPVLFFSAAAAVSTGILFGLYPALQLSRQDPGNALQLGMRRIVGSVRSRSVHNALVSGQIALTLLLLAGAGAAIQGFQRLLHAPLGYDPHNVISVWTPLPEHSYTNWSGRTAYFEQLQAVLSHVPGVMMAAIATNATPPQSGWKMHVEVLGKSQFSQGAALVNAVGPGFFGLLHIPLLQGRLWSQTENHNGAHLAVINRTLAKTYFPNENALGKSIKLPELKSEGDVFASTSIADSWIQIVGVVEDSRNAGLRNPVSPAIFIPYTLSMPAGTVFLIRSDVAPLGLLPAIRRGIARVNSNQMAARVVNDLDHWVSDQPEWQQEHLVAWLFVAFAVLAQSLAAIGLFSVVSYAVAQRANEFGIRMALGAPRGHVLRIVFASAAVNVGTGIFVGTLLTVALNAALLKWVGGSLREPTLLPACLLLLAVVAAIACFLPARRAACVDPMTTLRSE
jgi:predicted permease